LDIDPFHKLITVYLLSDDNNKYEVSKVYEGKGKGKGKVEVTVLNELVIDFGEVFE
jgi:hypothetical protein